MDIRVLIVDDEPFARERIRDFLKNAPEIVDIDEVENGPQAIRKIQAQNPDLVFLDIQMPRMDGFEVLKAVGPEKMPQVVFVTAHDQYALQAFEVFALGYLLKPFDREKFEKILERALDQIRLRRTGRDLARTMKEFLKDIQPLFHGDSCLILKTGDKITLSRSYRDQFNDLFMD
jgi:two-component system LytT family response regulator